MAEQQEKKAHTTEEAATTETTKNIAAAAAEPKPKKSRDLSSFAAIAAVLLLVLVVVQVFQMNSLQDKINAKTSESAELAKPSAIQLTSMDAECGECAQLSGVQSAVEAAKVNITRKQELKASETDAKAMIAKYSIKRLPTIIITGEIENANLGVEGFTKVDDALVYTGTPAPYVDTTTGKVKGLVSVAYVNATGCEECPDLLPVLQQLQSQVKVTSLSIYDKDSADAKRLIDEQSVKRLPAILLSSDITEYPLGKQLLQSGATVNNDVIAISANPPYINLSTGKVGGVASLILLNDSSCKSCYDVTLHIPLVTQRFQVYLASTKTVDVVSGEGKALVSKYKVDAVPTILITGDAAAYDSLTAIWQSVGTIESNGTYVFRNMAAIAGSLYRNLTTGKVEPNNATAQ